MKQIVLRCFKRSSSFSRLAKISVFAISIFLFSSLQTVKAYEYAFHTYTEDVLPDVGGIFYFFQDSRGLMWIGGSRGILRYDGQEFKRYSVTNGLSNNWCHKTVESPNGDLWTCTGTGISVYNYKTNQIKTHPLHSSENFRDVIFFNEDFYALATDGGVKVFRGKGQYQVELGTSTVINEMAFDERENLLWVATEANGVFSIDMTGYMSIWEMKDRELQKKYEEIGKVKFEEEYGRNAILDSNLYKIENRDIRQTFFEFHRKQFFGQDIDKAGVTYRISQDINGDIWAIGGRKLLKLNNNELIKEDKFEFQTELNLKTDYVYEFRVSDNGTKLISGRNGLFAISDQDTLILNDESGLINRLVSASYMDSQGVIWIASNQDLQKLSTTAFEIYDQTEQRFLHNIIDAVADDKQTLTYANSVGIGQYKNGEFNDFVFQPDDELISRIDLVDGKILVSTYTGFYLVDGDDVNPIVTDLSPHNWIFNHLISEDEMWISRGTQVFSYDGNELKNHPEIPNIHGPQNINFIHHIGNEELFIGTWFGLYHIKGQEGWRYNINDTWHNKDIYNPEENYNFVRETSSSEMVDHAIICGAVAPDSTLWVGTFSGGLIQIKNDSLYSYGSQEGVSGAQFWTVLKKGKSDNLYFFGNESLCEINENGLNPLIFNIHDYPGFKDIEIDEVGRKYIATSRGLLISTAETDFLCDVSFGLKESEVFHIEAMSDSVYALWQRNNFVLFKPDKMFETTMEPENPIITGVGYDSIYVSIEKEIKFPLGIRDIWIKFTLPDYFNEKQNRFSWKMSDLSEDYTEVSSSNEATLERLPPGEYKFHLRSIDGRGRFNDLPSPVTIIIPPYFYETATFNVIVVIFLLILVYLGYKWRLHRLEVAKYQLEQTVIIRTQEVSEARDEAVEAYKKLGEAQQKLMDMARRTGMAEIATNILHNVGNALTTAITFSTSIYEAVKNANTIKSLSRFTEMLHPHSDTFDVFVSEDPRGKKIPAYMDSLHAAMREEQKQLTEKNQTLADSLEHIRRIVDLQQDHAATSGMTEEVDIADVLLNTAQLFDTVFEQDLIHFSLETDSECCKLILDKHRLVQIITNLLNNACDALKEHEDGEKRITIATTCVSSDQVNIICDDNGIGIATDKLKEIFGYGYSTKIDGHGYGLHGSANLATEMNGKLFAESNGLGKGASFVLELPINNTRGI